MFHTHLSSVVADAECWSGERVLLAAFAGELVIDGVEVVLGDRAATDAETRNAAGLISSGLVCTCGEITDDGEVVLRRWQKYQPTSALREY